VGEVRRTACVFLPKAPPGSGTTNTGMGPRSRRQTRPVVMRVGQEGGYVMSVRSSYSVVGMTCGHCVQVVTSELSKVPGVHAVDVDLATGEVEITSDGLLPLDAVRTAVDEAGYALAGTHA